MKSRELDITEVIHKNSENVRSSSERERSHAKYSTAIPTRSQAFSKMLIFFKFLRRLQGSSQRGARNENILASKLYESAPVWIAFHDLVTTSLQNLCLHTSQVVVLQKWDLLKSFRPRSVPRQAAEDNVNPHRYRRRGAVSAAVSLLRPPT